MTSPPKSPKKTATGKTSNEETNTTDEHEKVHEVDNTQVAPVTTTKADTVTAKDNTIITTQSEKAIAKEAFDDKEQNDDPSSPTGNKRLQSHRHFKTQMLVPRGR